MVEINAMLRMQPQEEVSFGCKQNLFSIIKTIEFLEYSYMTGSIKGADYHKEFTNLHHLLKTTEASIPGFNGYDSFMEQYNLSHCQSAKMRIREGKSGYKGEEMAAGIASRVFEITTKFIGPIDVLQLGITAVDEVLPHVTDLGRALQSFPNMPAAYQGTAKVDEWSKILSAKKASDNLTEDEVRQLKLDLDSACQQFKDVVCS